MDIRYSCDGQHNRIMGKTGQLITKGNNTRREIKEQRPDWNLNRICME